MYCCDDCSRYQADMSEYGWEVEEGKRFAEGHMMVERDVTELRP